MDNDELKDEMIEDAEIEANTEAPAEDANGSASTPLEECAKEREEYLQGWQRTKADFANYKKEETKRLEEFARYQAEGMIKEFLTIIDSFDLAIADLEKKGGADQGIRLIHSQMTDLLRRRGVTKIDISPGDPYDPAVAEAIAEAESDLPEHSVVEEVSSGYRFGTKVIRPARVRISKGKSE